MWDPKLICRNFLEEKCRIFQVKLFSYKSSKEEKNPQVFSTLNPPNDHYQRIKSQLKVLHVLFVFFFFKDGISLFFSHPIFKSNSFSLLITVITYKTSSKLNFSNTLKKLNFRFNIFHIFHILKLQNFKKFARH